MKKGLLVILSGPSGVGKGTIRNQFINDPSLNLAYSISMTTRKPRVGEVNGVDYFFVSKEEFETAIANNELLEYAQFVDNYYGTPLSNVEKLRNEGKNVLLEIEVQGAIEALKRCPDALTIFVLPPSMEELEHRIRNRKSENDEVIAARLEKAKMEMLLVNQYKYAVCNDDVELASDIISMIIKRHMEYKK